MVGMRPIAASRSASSREEVCGGTDGKFVEPRESRVEGGSEDILGDDEREEEEEEEAWKDGERK